MPNTAKPSKSSALNEITDDDMIMTVQPWSDSSDEVQESLSEEDASDWAPEILQREKVPPSKRNKRRAKPRKASPLKKMRSEVEPKEYRKGIDTLGPLTGEQESLRTTVANQQNEIKHLQDKLRKQEIEILHEKIHRAKREEEQRQQETNNRMAAMEARLLALAQPETTPAIIQSVDADVRTPSIAFFDPTEASGEAEATPVSGLESVCGNNPVAVSDAINANEDENIPVDCSQPRESITSSSKLAKPLSELTKYRTLVPLVDVASFVNRSTEERQREMNNSGQVKRPLNAFFLYRKAYQNRTKDWCLQSNHQVVSQVCGESWRLEPKEVRKHFEKLAQIEHANHRKAHPNYKFAPRRADQVPKELELSTLGIYQCSPCQVTWLIGTEGEEAGKSHPSHHTQSPEYSRSLLVFTDSVHTPSGASLSIHFAVNSKFNINEIIKPSSSVTKDKLALESIFRALKTVRLQVLPGRQDLINVAMSGRQDYAPKADGVKDVMKMKLVLMTSSWYVAKIMSTHHEIWKETGTEVLDRNMKNKPSMKGSLMKVRMEAGMLSKLGVQVTFYLVREISKMDYALRDGDEN